MAGLFDVTPQAVRQQQAERARMMGMQRAGLPAGRGMVAAAGQAGGAFGQGIGEALGGQNPEMAKAQSLQAIKQKMDGSGINIQDNPYEYLTTASRHLMEGGFSEEALIALEQSKSFAPKGKKYGEFGQDVAQISAIKGVPFIDQTTAEKKDTLAQVGVSKKALAEAGKVDVDVSVDTSQKAFANAINKKGVEFIFEKRGLAEDALMLTESNKEALALLDKGMITGFGANFLTTFGNLLHQGGITFDDDPVSNTQAYVGASAKRVAAIIKAFGAGTGLSDADREYALKAAAGDITMTEPAIRKLININNKAANNTINYYNGIIDKVRPDIIESAPFDLRITRPVKDKPLSEMTEAELQAIISGQ